MVEVNIGKPILLRPFLCADKIFLFGQLNEQSGFQWARKINNKTCNFAACKLNVLYVKTTETVEEENPEAYPNLTACLNMVCGKNAPMYR